MSKKKSTKKTAILNAANTTTEASDVSTELIVIEETIDSNSEVAVNTDTIEEVVADETIIADAIETQAIENSDVSESTEIVAIEEIDTIPVTIEEMEIIDTPDEAIVEKKTKKSLVKDNAVKRVRLTNTSYHYFRNWIKDLLRSNEINSAKFIKDSSGWNGHINILETELAKALEVLEQYRIDNADTKILWWEANA